MRGVGDDDIRLRDFFLHGIHEHLPATAFLFAFDLRVAIGLFGFVLHLLFGHEAVLFIFPNLISVIRRGNHHHPRHHAQAYALRGLTHKQQQMFHVDSRIKNRVIQHIFQHRIREPKDDHKLCKAHKQLCN